MTTFQEFQTGPKAVWINKEDKLWGREGEEKTELHISIRENKKEELPWVKENEYEKGKKQKKKNERKRKEEEEQKKGEEN